MYLRIVLPALAVTLASGCKSVDCGPGTAEKNGSCVPSSETVGTAKCGPFTELHGDTCVPMFPPTTCDPDTTQPDTDVGTGVTTCIGTGAASCSAKLACPAGATGKQTLCGQIFDFETGQPLADAGATGAACASVTASGPCSLGIQAFDAVALATNPAGTAPLTTGQVYIDNCGRYRVTDVNASGTMFVALAVDDAAPANRGIAGTTNPAGVAAPTALGAATKDLELFVVRQSTITAWGAKPTLASGIYAPIYRGHRTGTDLAPNVHFTFGPRTSPPPTMTDASRTFYFGASATARMTLDSTATATGVNGTALVNGANLNEIYSGNGGLSSAMCTWEIHAGGAVPGVVFVQIFRPTDIPSMTCPL
jgi:hypothetical protein